MALEVDFLMDNEHEYFKRYRTKSRYRRHTFIEEQQWRLKNTFQNFDFCKGIATSVLSIGTSDGTKDIPIIDALLRRVEIVNYVVIEPSESEINKFKEFVSSKQDNGEWQNVRFTFYQVALQTYLRKAIEAGEKTCFDIILALHCAYFFTDPGQTFVDLYELLKNGGTLFNIMCAGAWEKLLKEVGRHVGRRAAPCYGSIELRGILQQRMPGLKMKILQRKDDVEVDECFKEDSKDGNEILDFILQIVDVRKNLPKDVVDKLLLYLREQCCRTVDGKLYFESGDEDIVIVKE